MPGITGRIQLIRERLRLAERGEIVFFYSRYGGRGEGVVLKAVCFDPEKLRKWASENGLPDGTVFAPGTALPSLTLTGKQARAVLGKLIREGRAVCPKHAQAAASRSVLSRTV